MYHHETSLTVRTYECDLYGHVNNAVFLNYCETARVEFLYALRFTLHSLKEKGFILPIVKIEIEYKKPVFPGEELKITVEWIKKGKSSSVFCQDIIRKKDDKMIARALVTWVVTDLRGKPIPMPEELLETFNQKFGLYPPE